MIASFTGFVAGLLHVISGPDHLAAVAPYAAMERKLSWKVGMHWGFGHSSGVLLVGLALLSLRESLPLEWLSSWGESLVGAILIIIGIQAFASAFKYNLHAHTHEHGGSRHTHFHLHNSCSRHIPHGTGKHRHAHVPLLIGTLHGLAGSSHFFGVLPALALPSAAASCSYLLFFILGAITAMTAFSSLLGHAAEYAFIRRQAWQLMMYIFSLAAFVTGGFWLLTKAH